MGVELYEVRPDIHVTGAERAGNEGSRATLHTKAFVVDDERLFVGSFNFDPRSVNLNTEMGIILDAPELATEVVESIDRALPQIAYRLDLDEWNQLRWTTSTDGDVQVWDHEPETSWWMRTKVNLMGLLPIQGQL
jgi:putative cardiolipin synthase